MKLNSQQKQAVEHSSGPLLIVAGAGTGKTTVITERIKHLIQSNKVDSQQIFATTFTQKSAEEMLARLDEVMPLGYRQPWIGTFHSLCDRILRDKGLEIGLDPSFTLMTQTDQWIFIKEHLFQLELDYYRPLGNPAKFITALIKFFSRLQDEMITPKAFQHYATEQNSKASGEEETGAASRLVELAAAYEIYQQLKIENSLMDFGDLISQTAHLFSSRPNILGQYQEQFQHILVDEFQDTNYAQYQLIKLLAPAANDPNLVVVGDDDQAIYKFRGASVANILQFKQDYPKTKQVVLTSNYRSTQQILDSSYQAITNNNPDRLETKLDINKQLQSQLSLNVQPQIMSFEHLDEEVDWTIREIIKLVASEGITYQDIAILTRSNSQLEPYAAALKRNGIPYQLVANRGLFDQPEIQDLLYFFKAIVDPQDDQVLFQFSQSHIFHLNQAQLLESMRQAKRHSSSLWQQLQQQDDSNIKEFIQLIQQFQQELKSATITQLLYSFINQTDYIKEFITNESVENQLKIKNINLFFNKLKQFEASSQNKQAVQFLQTLDQWLEAGENPGQAQIEDIDTISLMTVHAAKGLEFPAVFVGSLVAGRFPGINRKDPIQIPDELIPQPTPEGDIHIQEERRLFYVACTRAKQHLFLTHAQDYGGKRKWKPSGFLEETKLKIQSIEPQSDDFHLKPATSHPTPQYLKSSQYQITHLSYSQIDTFKLCPLKYKYRYLLQIPAQPHHSLSFGRTIHQTLHQFHQRQMQGDTPTQEELIDLYKQNFIDEGYDSPEHKQARFQAGIQAMKDYYQNYQQLFDQPEMLEQSFKLKFGDITFSGKIDRIDKDNRGEYHIIDYKTGTHKDQKKVDKDEQLSLYGLAAKEAMGLDIQNISLYFLEEGGKKVSTTRDEKQLEKVRSKLEKDIKDITTSTFPAKPDPVKCGFCEYAQICPFAAKKNG